MPGTFGGGGVEVFAGTVIRVGDGAGVDVGEGVSAGTDGGEGAAQAPSKSAQIARTDSIIFISARALLQAFHISELKFNPALRLCQQKKGRYLANE